MLLQIWSTAATVIVLCAASITDLRWRRIPNELTFPAIALGLVMHQATGGWVGVLLSISGALAAPLVLCMLHGGKGPGMGDIKLAAALGAMLGPLAGTLAVLLSAAGGGVVALLWMLGAWLRRNPFKYLYGYLYQEPDADGGQTDAPVGCKAIPYGLAIGIGTLMALAICWGSDDIKLIL